MERKLMNKLPNSERKKIYEQRLEALKKLMADYPFKKYKELEELSNGRFKKGWIAQQVHMRAI